MPVEIRSSGLIKMGFRQKVVSFLDHYVALTRMLGIVNFSMLLSELHNL